MFKTMPLYKLVIIYVLLIFVNCQKNSINKNPYIPDLKFDYDINLNLPEYDNLKFVGGTKIIDRIGYKGVIVFNLNGNNFLAWEASCPNEIPSNCSKTKIEGVLAVCEYNENKYSLATGQIILDKTSTKKYFPLVNYGIIKTGNILKISN